jgi:hypothetical protein
VGNIYNEDDCRAAAIAQGDDPDVEVDDGNGITYHFGHYWGDNSLAAGCWKTADSDTGIWAGRI